MWLWHAKAPFWKSSHSTAASCHGHESYWWTASSASLRWWQPHCSSPQKSGEVTWKSRMLLDDFLIFLNVFDVFIRIQRVCTCLWPTTCWPRKPTNRGKPRCLSLHVSKARMCFGVSWFSWFSWWVMMSHGVSSDLMFISPTGSSSGMPCLKLLWFLIWCKVLSSALRESSLSRSSVLN